MQHLQFEEKRELKGLQWPLRIAISKDFLKKSHASGLVRYSIGEDLLETAWRLGFIGSFSRLS